MWWNFAPSFKYGLYISTFHPLTEAAAVSVLESTRASGQNTRDSQWTCKQSWSDPADWSTDGDLWPQDCCFASVIAVFRHSRSEQELKSHQYMNTHVSVFHCQIFWRLFLIQMEMLTSSSCVWMCSNVFPSLKSTKSSYQAAFKNLVFKWPAWLNKGIKIIIIIIRLLLFIICQFNTLLCKKLGSVRFFNVLYRLFCSPWLHSFNQNILL